MDSTVDQFSDAAFKGDVDAVERLIAQGIDINAMGSVWNPLHAAVENAQVEVVRLLIRAGADLEFVCNKATPLSHAVDMIIDGAMQQNWSLERCSKQGIDMLLEAGADIEPGLETARAYQCAVVEDHLQRRFRSISSPGATSTVAGSIELPDAKTVAKLLKSAGWTIEKEAGRACIVRGKDFEIYLESGSPVLAYGPAAHPDELVRKLTKAFDDASVRYFFEVYAPAGYLKEVITHRKSVP
jgi:hypothetical protein